MTDSVKTQLSRRKFIVGWTVGAATAFLGANTALAQKISDAFARVDAQKATSANPLTEPEHIIHTTCLGCHSQCAVKAKVYDGVLVKMDGNPYGPNGRLPHLPYETALTTEAPMDGKMCLKGQTGIQVQYDPYRITKALKRAGKRGENKWTTISFDQAMDEIVNGGLLFKNVPGEENRKVEGLKDIWALRDAAVSAEMAKDVDKILAAPQGDAKKQAVEAFKQKFSNFKGKNWLDTLIDPNHPDLGPKNNQLLWFGGRVQYGREAFTQRWAYKAFGSVNWINHCTVCGGSHRCGHALYTMSFDNKAGQFQNTAGVCYDAADFTNTEFLLLFGHSIFEANYGPTHLTQRVIDGMTSGRLTLVAVDPRLSKSAAKAHKWIAPLPATDGALIWGMIRWILENKRYDQKFLENGNKAAAVADGETTWPNGVYLVKIESDGPGNFLRTQDLGLDPGKLFVWQNGALVAVDPNDAKNPVQGDLFYDGVVEQNGKQFKVKTGWQIILEYAQSRTLDDWAKACGVDTDTITWLAREFTSHGKKAVADGHRGLATTGTGSFAVLAMNTLNTLIGNFDWKGGYSVGGGKWDYTGGHEGQPYPLGNLTNGALTMFGIPSSKQDSMQGVGIMKLRYENTTLFEGYPAKRQWYGPPNWGIYQEPLPAAVQGYPYKIKALYLACWTTPAASIYGAQPQIDALANVDAIPLIFANDIVIGESSMYADYVFPDVSYLEEFQISKPPSANLPHKFNPIRQPVVAPVVDTCKVYGQETPISMEAVHMAIAERLGLPGHGKDGFASGQDLVHSDQFYIKLAANVAFGDSASDSVPDANDDEIEIFKKARTHLPVSVFDYERWRQAAGDKMWRKVVYIMNRGGRFENFELAWKGDHLAHQWANSLNVYNETLSQMIHSGTGKRLPGIGAWHPIQDFLGNDLLEMDRQAGYQYTLISYKIVGGANYRGMAPYYWLLELTPENYIVMHQDDAAKQGLADGDMVKLVSASNPDGMWDLRNGQRFPVGGKVKTTVGIRPGVIAVAWSFGHWAYGATDVVVDGVTVPGDPRRGAGLNPNVVMRLDPVLKDVPVSDPVGGQCAIPTRVNVARMSAAELALLQKYVPGQVLLQGTSKTYLGGA